MTIGWVTGKERNGVVVYDRRGDFAATPQGVTLQGMENGGRFNVFRTFDDQAAADAAPELAGLSVRGLCQFGYCNRSSASECRTQDSNLHCPESESGASCRWASAAK